MKGLGKSLVGLSKIAALALFVQNLAKYSPDRGPEGVERLLSWRWRLVEHGEGVWRAVVRRIERGSATGGFGFSVLRFSFQIC